MRIYLTLAAMFFATAAWTAAPVRAQSGADDLTVVSSVDDIDGVEAEFASASLGKDASKGYGDDCYCGDSPWTLYFTQTADYGTSLALPFNLSPANTLVAPLGNVDAADLLGNNLAGNLGILDDLGVLPGPIANNPSVPVFEDDMQFQTTVGGQYQRQIDYDSTLTANMAYYQSLHPDLEQLDLRSLTGSLQYERTLSDRLTATIDYLYAYYWLQQTSYVSQNRVGGSVSYLVNDDWTWTVRGNFTDSDFRSASFLDAEYASASIEATRYLYGSQDDYVTMGYTYGDWQAAAPAFSYLGNGLYATGRWIYGDCNEKELRLTGNYGVYRFGAVDPLDMVTRRDEIWSAQAYMGRWISDETQLFASYTYLDSDSSVVRQLYDSSVISLGVTITR